MTDHPKQIGAYRISGLLGRGGMGSVYLATHEDDGREVALKVLAEGLAEADGTALRRFELELEVLSRLDHPGITRALGPMERDGSRAYFPLEYVRGRTLSAAIKDDGPFTVRKAVQIARGVLGALEAAHAVGVIHRDVKPSNVLLDEAGNVRVADFGLARLQDATRFTSTGQVMGTLHYISPEQCEGTRAIDFRADVYSAGIVLYEMLAGRPPFQADTPVALIRSHLVTPPPAIESVRPDVPPELSRLVSDCLAKRPDDRAASVTAVLERIDALPQLPDTCEMATPAPPSELPTREQIAATVVRAAHETATSPAAAIPATPSAPAAAEAPSRRGRGAKIAGGIVIGVLALAAASAAFQAGRDDGRRDRAGEGAPTAGGVAVVGRLGAAIRSSDFKAFRACLSGSLRDRFGDESDAASRYRDRLASVDASEFTPGLVMGDLSSGKINLLVTGAALPAALAMDPGDSADGVRLTLSQKGQRWLVTGAVPSRGAPGDRDRMHAAADRAMRQLLRPDRFRQLLQEAGDDSVTPARRKKMRALTESLRRGGAPGRMDYELLADNIDADTGAWRVIVKSADLSRVLENEDARIEVVLQLAKRPRGGMGYTIGSARLIRN